MTAKSDYLTALPGNLATRRAQIVAINTAMQTVVDAIAAYRQINKTLLDGATSLSTLPASEKAVSALAQAIRGGMSIDIASIVAATKLRSAGNIPFAAALPQDPLIYEDGLATALSAALTQYLTQVGA